MDAKRERRFLLLAGLLILASWALAGLLWWAKHHRLYSTYSNPAVVERRLPDGRYLVRLERALVVRRLPGAGGDPATMSPADQTERAQVVQDMGHGRYLVRLLSEETAVVEIPDHIARTRRSVMVFRREYLGGFKTRWRASY
jgi:hypothetical protein